MSNNQNSNSSNKNSNNKRQVRMRVANDSKQWITEKCGTNTPPPTPPKSQSKGNKKSK